MARQRRDQRRSGVRVTLTKRDEALLHALSRFRLARSSDLHRLFFPGRHPDVLADRLRRLYDGHYLEAHVVGLAAENVYSLGREGQAWLRAHGQTVHSVPRPPWLHHLGIVRLWSRLAATTHGLGGLRLVHFVPDWQARQGGGAAGLEVVPDAVVDLAGDLEGQPMVLRIWVELDRGTESLEIFRRKLRTLAAQPQPSVILAVVLEDAGRSRTEKVRDLLSTEWPGIACLWTEETDLAAELLRLLSCPTPPGTDSRHGSGREGSPTPAPATSPPVTGGGLSEDA
jgi:hypothetical protein